MVMIRAKVRAGGRDIEKEEKMGERARRRERERIRGAVALRERRIRKRERKRDYTPTL